MRHTLLLLIFTSIGLLINQGCKQSVSATDNSVHGAQTLPGVWELRTQYGGYSASGGGNYLPANGNKWKFSDSAYWVYAKNIVTDSGVYKFSSGTNPQTQLKTNAMLLNNDISFPLYFTIENDTLTIYHGVVAADGYIEKYVRIENP